MKKRLIFQSKILPFVFGIVLSSAFLIGVQSIRAEAETETSIETNEETVVKEDEAIKSTEEVVEQKVLTVKEKKLFEALPGDMVVVYSKDASKSCRLIVEDQNPDKWPLQLEASFPSGNCVNNDRGVVWYESIIAVGGEDGNLIVIPKADVPKAQQVMFWILTLFEKN